MEKQIEDLSIQDNNFLSIEDNATEISSSEYEDEDSEEDDEEEELKTKNRININKRSKLDNEHKQITDSEKGQILAKYSDKLNDESNIKYAKIDKDKSDRATVENAIDPKTFKQLQKFIKNGTLTKIDGCLSTGKEANIYYGINEETGKEYAIKVYKTSVLVFKDRERYISGEFRFKSFKNSNKINARKLIKVWSEKEFRNLKRLKLNGFNVPEPYELKSNILMMEFLSRRVNSKTENQEIENEVDESLPSLNISEKNEKGWPAPRLKDYEYQSSEQIFNIYQKILVNMRLMYHKCRLVHADLSEYNLIMYNDEIYIIDVSQSVEPTHPMALDFLRMDIKNINDYFQKKTKVEVYMERDIFKYVSEDFSIIVKDFGGDGLNIDNVDQYNFENLMKLVNNLKLKITEEDEKEDKIFRNLHLMRDLNSLEEEDFTRFREGKIDVFKTMVVDNKENEDDINEETEDDEDDSEDEDYEERSKELKGKKYEDKDEKKLRKKLVKDQKQEKRKNKMKKNVKNKLVKRTQKKK